MQKKNIILTILGTVGVIMIIAGIIVCLITEREFLMRGLILTFLGGDAIIFMLSERSQL